MSNSLLRPDFKADIADLRRRVSQLERRLVPISATARVANDDIIFSYAGVLASSAESPPVKLRYGGFLSTLAVALGASGSSSTTLQIEQNGTVVATVTIGSAISDLVEDVGLRVNPEDRISLVVDTAGAGAADMTATARFT